MGKQFTHESGSFMGFFLVPHFNGNAHIQFAAKDEVLRAYCQGTSHHDYVLAGGSLPKVTYTQYCKFFKDFNDLYSDRYEQDLSLTDPGKPYRETEETNNGTNTNSPRLAPGDSHPSGCIVPIVVMAFGLAVFASLYFYY